MTPADVAKRVEAIVDHAGDCEVQHSLEDELYRDVLASIALGMSGDDAADLARAALCVRDIDFDRWCA